MSKSPQTTQKAHEEVGPKQPSTEIATGQGTAIATIDYGDDSGAGGENIGRDEQLIPFFRILQANSPQVEDNTIEGAKPGMIINTATSELFDGEAGLIMIPCYRDHNYVEYISRDHGGGFVGTHLVDSPFVLKATGGKQVFGKISVPGEPTHELTDTYSLYLMALDTEGFVQARGVLAFASTQIKKYKAFMSRYNSIRYKRDANSPPVLPPLFAHKWKFTTVKEKNKKGTFYGWQIQLIEEPPIKSRLSKEDPLYIQAKEFHELIKGGIVRANYEASPDHDPDTGELPNDKEFGG